MSSASLTSRTPVGEIGAVDERLLNNHREWAQLPEDMLRAQAMRILHYEVDLPADERRRSIIGRLRAWLLLDADDARRLAEAFDSALAGLETQERHVVREAEEDAVMDGLSYREFERLAQFMPSLQHWRDSIYVQLPPIRSGMPNSFAAALAMSGLASEW